MQIWTKIIAEEVRCAEGVTVNVGAQQQQQVCTSLSAIFFFFFFTQFLITFICVLKSLNAEERGGNCLLLPERSYGPDISACWRAKFTCIASLFVCSSTKNNNNTFHKIKTDRINNRDIPTNTGSLVHVHRTTHKT